MQIHCVVSVSKPVPAPKLVNRLTDQMKETQYNGEAKASDEDTARGQ